MEAEEEDDPIENSESEKEDEEDDADDAQEKKIDTCKWRKFHQVLKECAVGVCASFHCAEAWSSPLCLLQEVHGRCLCFLP